MQTTGRNLFTYCVNNPVNMNDTSGYLPAWITKTVDAIVKAFKKTVDLIRGNSYSNYYTATKKADHDANKRPYKGKPGSTYHAPNGDSRTYGPDGRPQHDYDHNDHGYPQKHPHDENGGHNHDWENGIRGPAYSTLWEPAVGVALVTVCVVGIVVVAADDLTGIGVADDFLFVPLGMGVESGLIMIFG